jgi:uncharacterized membrane protein
MPDRRINVDRLPKRFWVAANLLLVILLGVIDYETGDYSMIVFYMIPVVMGSWFMGVRFGIAVAIICGFVRLYADYETYTVFSFASYMNVAQDALFLLATACIASILRKMLKGNKAGLQDTGSK